MHYDSDYIDWTCAEGKHIMTDSLFRRGQITWSECSRTIATELWKRKSCLRDQTRRENLEDALDNLPGREWTAKAQCQLFLRDKDANVVTLHDICQVLQCETPHKDEYVFAGPALNGTYCAYRKECRGGECVPVIEPPYIFPYCAHDNWSEWKNDFCKSNCLMKSKGAIIKRRFCKHETYETASCSGPYYDVNLCNDSSLCTEERKTIVQYTTEKCNELRLRIEKRGEKYFKYFKYKPLNVSGRQEPYDIGKPWIACTIFCLREDNIIYNIRKSSLHVSHKVRHYYTPHSEMLEFGINPYFPDGTWCHNKDGQDYYCRQHYCMPENYSNEE